MGRGVGRSLSGAAGQGLAPYSTLSRSAAAAASTSG